ncbi:MULTISPECIES: hypothetical protein [Actibacterium]|uniref:Uncharacterized protein n=1 Tax=Actibacterium naphthalenivorans TaxID=1614693 RepID=A0A840CAQ7_9RHOB|nr:MULTISPECIES: hypothetical protein [Actibacterium]MBB4020439.1 hypothetical protein [Actibacterium naphthalenivorans]
MTQPCIRITTAKAAARARFAARGGGDTAAIDAHIAEQLMLLMDKDCMADGCTDNRDMFDRLGRDVDAFTRTRPETPGPI